jgi:hypothetical protein
MGYVIRGNMGERCGVCHEGKMGKMRDLLVSSRFQLELPNITYTHKLELPNCQTYTHKLELPNIYTSQTYTHKLNKQRYRYKTRKTSKQRRFIQALILDKENQRIGA